jgi:3-phenylpropionate/cinnamic acid dioxygenase small subunit
VTTSAEQGIERALMLYAWGYDENDMDLVAAAFTPDAELVFAPDPVIEDVEALGGDRRTIGRDAIIAQFRASRATFDERGERPWHIVTNMLIESRDEERARVRCCYLFYTQSASGLRLHGLSRYHDDFVRHDGEWRIRTRRNVVSHLGSRHAAEHGA